MAAYVIADVAPEDAEAYRASGYLEAAARTSKEYGGVYRVRGGALSVLEGEWEPERIVLIEFPSMERLLAWYNSAEYQKWAAVRREHIPNSRLVAVEGVDAP